MRLLRLGFIFVAGCLYLETSGQGFVRRYDPFMNGGSETAWGVECTADGGYMLMINGAWQENGFGYSSVVHSIRLDQNGIELAAYVTYPPHRAAYVGWSNTGGPLLDGSGFYSAGSTLDTTFFNRPSLVFWDNDGVPTTTIEYELATSSIGRQAKQTPDGGFVICGETTVDGVQSDAFLIKTDAQGVQVWASTYGGAFSDYSVTVDIKSVDGYFLGGEYRVASDNQDLWVQSVNDTGGVVWDRKWGSSFNEPNAHISTAADGNILVASSWAYGTNWTIKRYLTKLDAADGSTIWEQQYGPPPMNDAAVFYVVQEITPGGDLIAGGPHREGNNYFGALLRTDSEGDSLWMRFYQYYDTLVSNGRGLFRDVVPTPDGGFIACGTALPVSTADTLLYTQDVWVVKTDSMGCIEPGCHLITGVETQLTNLTDVLRVYPNPVLSGSAVSFALDLPVGFMPKGNLRVTVVSSDGRSVHDEVVPKNTVNHQLKANFAAGLYHLHLSDATRWISGSRFIVE